MLFRWRLNKTPIPPSTLKNLTIFQPTIWKSSTPLGELDFLGHKSNATYLTDFDAARVYHLSSVLRVGLHKWSNGQSGLLALLPVLGGVECSFRRSIKPGQRYDIVTRIIGWDQKWCFVVSHFVKEGVFRPRAFSDQGKGVKVKKEVRDGNGDLEKGNSGESESDGDGKDAVLAVVMGKMVFKNGRKTIPPAEVLGECGLVPAIEEGASFGWRTVGKPVDDAGAGDGSEPRVNAIDQQMVIAKAIEERRLWGLEVAQSINSLDEGVPFDFNEDVAFSKF